MYLACKIEHLSLLDRLSSRLDLRDSSKAELKGNLSHIFYSLSHSRGFLQHFLALSWLDTNSGRSCVDRKRMISSNIMYYVEKADDAKLLKFH